MELLTHGFWEDQSKIGKPGSGARMFGVSKKRTEVLLNQIFPEFVSKLADSVGSSASGCLLRGRLD